MISNCGHDENGRYSGGQAGDQTGTEWEIRAWYNRPWNYVLRHPDRSVGNLLAELGRAAANNPLVGYDQNQRHTYWQHLKASNYDPAQITIACEADCSSGVAANVKAAGYRLGVKSLQNVSSECYTGNLRAALKAAGFEVLTDSKYLTSDAYLLPGDILLYEGHHTATNLDTGSKAGGSAGGSGKPSVSGDTYTVKAGDTLSAIAKAMGVTTAELAAYNGISNPDVINVGQVIRRPGASGGSGGTQQPSADKQQIVRDAQIHLNNYVNAMLALDGIRGALTIKAGIMAVQQAMNMDYGAGLVLDGIWGPASNAALRGHTVRLGECQEMVRALQILLMAHGYDPNGVDGSFGYGCEAAVRQYQADHGLTVDGIAGYNTFVSLMAA